MGRVEDVFEVLGLGGVCVDFLKALLELLERHPHHPGAPEDVSVSREGLGEIRLVDHHDVELLLHGEGVPLWGAIVELAGELVRVHLVVRVDHIVHGGLIQVEGFSDWLLDGRNVLFEEFLKGLVVVVVEGVGVGQVGAALVVDVVLEAELRVEVHGDLCEPIHQGLVAQELVHLLGGSDLEGRHPFPTLQTPQLSLTQSVLSARREEP
mmetsp:Transcript_15926/g.15339  ORF Transcript_15926/g.15339 Transcript_15926/m.15339 type:complete len:209 (+) Transcript_15926:376-1002(+)